MRVKYSCKSNFYLNFLSIFKSRFLFKSFQNTYTTRQIKTAKSSKKSNEKNFNDESGIFSEISQNSGQSLMESNQIEDQASVENMPIEQHQVEQAHTSLNIHSQAFKSLHESNFEQASSDTNTFLKVCKFKA